MLGHWYFCDFPSGEVYYLGCAVPECRHLAPRGENVVSLPEGRHKIKFFNAVFSRHVANMFDC